MSAGITKVASEAVQKYLTAALNHRAGIKPAFLTFAKALKSNHFIFFAPVTS